MFRTVPLSIIRSMTYTTAVCTVKKTPDDGQTNCRKNLEFYSKNKFEKLVHLVGFIIMQSQCRPGVAQRVPGS